MTKATWFEDIREVWFHFCNTTSGHGLAYLGTRKDHADSASCKLGLFWASVVCIFLCLIIISEWHISEVYVSEHSLSSTYLQEKASTLDFPDLYLCDSRVFSERRLKGFNYTLATYLTLAISPTSSTISMKEDQTKQAELRDEFIRLVGDKPLEGIFQYTLLTCEEMVHSCLLVGTMLSSTQCCRDIFRNETSIRMLGACISSQGGPTLTADWPTQDRGVVIYMKMSLHDRIVFDTRLISLNHAAKHGMFYFVSSNSSRYFDMIPPNAGYVWPGSWASLPIEKTTVDITSVKNSWFAPLTCAESHETKQLPLLPSYSHDDCHVLGLQIMIEKLLNCSLYGLPKTAGKYPYCLPHEILQSNISSDQITAWDRENCLEDCVTDEYVLRPTYAKLHLNGLSYANNTSDYLTTNELVSALNFYYPSFTYTKIVSKPFGLQDWITSLGGDAGLFLGASIITLIEISIMLLRCLIPTICSVRTLD